MPSAIVGRLAPTPSGRLHLGNVCAFAAAWLSVRAQDGTLLLRIEDVDRLRANPEVEASLREDLQWLGLTWDREVPRQSEREYDEALARLAAWTYYCDCSRADVQRMPGGIHDGLCRERGLTTGALRFRLPDGETVIVDRARGRRELTFAAIGDPVLRRRDGEFAYNLAVVADDIEDGVTEVVRGADLLDVSAAQACLWEALGATPPTWLHAPLILGVDGRKLSKSHGSIHIGELRDAGWQQADVWRHVLPWLGVEPVERIERAVARFDPLCVQPGPIVWRDPLAATAPPPSPTSHTPADGRRSTAEPARPPG